jgi:hypothetical protein
MRYLPLNAASSAADILYIVSDALERLERGDHRDDPELIAYARDSRELGYLALVTLAVSGETAAKLDAVVRRLSNRLANGSPGA